MVLFLSVKHEIIWIASKMTSATQTVCVRVRAGIYV